MANTIFILSASQGKPHEKGVPDMKYNRNSIEEVCLSCGEMIIIKKPVRLGQMVKCVYCGVQLEIADLDPLYLDWPYYSDDYEDDLEEVYFEDGGL
jgi:lysine biosynthesis protein LysW